MKRTLVLCVTTASLLLGQVQAQHKMSDAKMSQEASPANKMDRAAKKKADKMATDKMATDKMTRDKMHNGKMNNDKMADHSN